MTGLADNDRMQLAVEVENELENEICEADEDEAGTRF